MRPVITIRHVRFSARIRESFRILHISDVHFSAATAHEKNLRTIAALTGAAGQCRPALIAVTGDLVSRDPGAHGIRDAVTLTAELGTYAPVAYSLGNHETDLPEGQRQALLTLLRRAGAIVLDNSSVQSKGITFTGLTLPGTVYKNEKGRYYGLRPVTRKLVTECAGACTAHPCVLLAHSPMGFPAYAAWGADIVLSGHVHGGIVRVPGLGGILSPERRFFPAYTKGIYALPGCRMNVSAGIGKLRVNNPAEVICVDLIPQAEQ